MHVDPNTFILYVLSIFVGAAGMGLRLLQLQSKWDYVKALQHAVYAAEKAIDALAYNKDTGAYNQAREDFAIAVMKFLIPNLNEAKARADIEAIVQEVHHTLAVIPVPAAPAKAASTRAKKV